MALTLACLCGAVRVAVAHRPAFIHACNCSLCSKTGARWGYFAPDSIAVSGATSGYARTDKAEANADVRFCPACGVTTHFVLTPGAIARVGNTMAGVNMALAAPEALTGIELRYPDGRGWAGDGAFDYVRPPRTLGPDGLT